VNAARVCGNCRYYLAQGDEQAGGCYSDPPRVQVIPVPTPARDANNRVLAPTAGVQAPFTMTPAYMRPLVQATDVGCRFFIQRPAEETLPDGFPRGRPS